MTNKACEICGNLIFSTKNHVCPMCKKWGLMLKAFHAHYIGPVRIADEIYERLVHKLEEPDFFYGTDEDGEINKFQYDIDENFLNIIQPFTFWGVSK
jgi:hypothetical protein